MQRLGKPVRQSVPAGALLPYELDFSSMTEYGMRALDCIPFNLLMPIVRRFQIALEELNREPALRLAVA